MKAISKHVHVAAPAKDDTEQFTPAGTFPDFRVDEARCIRWVLDGSKPKHSQVHSGHPLIGPDGVDYVIDASDEGKSKGKAKWLLYRLSDVTQVDDNNTPISE